MGEERDPTAAGDVERRESAEELQRGLREHELLLHYQPIFARQAGEWRLRSTEALVRWQHPGRGLLYPGQFLKLAESAGLLGELTDFVFAAAMRQAGSWEAQGLELAVDINLSPALVRDSGFLERFMRTLKEYEVSPERITLEVESILRRTFGDQIFPSPIRVNTRHKAAPSHRQTIYEFEGDTLDGDVLTPDGRLIQWRMPARHPSLIRVRDNFVSELIRLATDV